MSYLPCPLVQVDQPPPQVILGYVDEWALGNLVKWLHLSLSPIR